MPRKAKVGQNDLKTIYPNLVEDWDYEENINNPECFLPGSGAKVSWKCHSCGNKWKAVISSRVNGRGCPYCSGARVMPGVTDLMTKNPEIAQEWHPTKNGSLMAKDVSYGSKKKVWWICPKGHEYEQYVCKRTLRGMNCPICSGHKTVKGINDFQTVYPEIAKEWNYEKNGDKEPHMFSPKNGFSAWWICKYGHEWKATIHDRASGTGCPICKNRYSSSFPEQAIYYYVRQICPDAENRFKGLLGNNMEFDIYIPSRKIAIEFDGAYWHNSETSHEKEASKYSFCRTNGIYLIRVKEENKSEWRDVADVIYYLKKKDNEQLQNIIQGIIDTLDPESNQWTRKKVGKYHSNLVVDLKRDKQEILSYLKAIPNSLEELRPDLIAEWNYKRNGKLTPDLFGINSNEKVWWKCENCGHEWKTTIISRAGKRNAGCPECAKIRKGQTFSKNKALERGSLADRMPELLKQWNYDRNEVDPKEIALNYNKKVWWKCDKCNYEWKSSPNNRSKGVGCPCCAGRVPMIGVNDLKTINPDLCEEWDYKKNEKGPEEYLPNSGKKVWWKCGKCGHEWFAVIRSRNREHGCPNCAAMKRRKQ